MESPISAEEIFEDILDEVFDLPFSRTTKIVDAEKKVYAALQQYPSDICGLITLMFIEIMLGNRQKAKDLAYRIWEIGGNLPTYFEQIYLENLLSLGLVDMASILLKPRLENLSANIEDFYSVFLKYAIMTGNIELLNRFKMFPTISAEDELLYSTLGIFEETNCLTQFKDLQKIILDNTEDILCAYEYNLYDDRGFPEIEIVIYTNHDDISCLKMQNNLEKKIDAYWNSCGKERLYCLGVTIHNIRLHESWLGEDD
ncbi:MAG: hypothetical protein IKA03_02575 [Alphaproteobacteria bacterium]|nr:hypothetical protein [Alphaproteobacteria bacterium]